MYKAFACDAVVIDDGDEGLLRYCVSEVSEVGRNVAFDDGEIARVVIENFRVIGERGFHVGDVVLGRHVFDDMGEHVAEFFERRFLGHAFEVMSL